MVTSCTPFLLKITQSEMQVRLDIGWDIGCILAKTFRLERIDRIWFMHCTLFLLHAN